MTYACVDSKLAANSIGIFEFISFRVFSVANMRIMQVIWLVMRFLLIRIEKHFGNYENRTPQSYVVKSQLDVAGFLRKILNISSIWANSTKNNYE